MGNGAAVYIKKRVSVLSTAANILWWIYILVLFYSLASEIWISTYAYNDTMAFDSCIEYCPVDFWGHYWFAWIIFHGIPFLPGVFVAIFFPKQWKGIVVIKRNIYNPQRT
jgi:hypothetical protein